jgi:hypothetical protein
LQNILWRAPVTSPFHRVLQSTSDKIGVFVTWVALEIRIDVGCALGYMFAEVCTIDLEPLVQKVACQRYDNPTGDNLKALKMERMVLPYLVLTRK